jgi:acetyl-CoA C-acetyltransferase
MATERVFIVSIARTPIGSFNGILSSLSAPNLGAIAIKGALEKAKIDAETVQEVYMGNVLQAGVGQAPARQAAMFAGVPETVPATTINKVCASGMKAIQLATQSIQLGQNDIVVAGGMESMSNVPYYLPNMRSGNKLGHVKAIDGLVFDGLTDVYNNYHMGSAAELCAKECKISREDQDKYAIQSYERSAKAWEEGKFENEVVAVEIPQKKGDPMTVIEDEEFRQVKMDKIPSLRPVFDNEGTVTAANASTINDGAAAVVLASESAIKKYGLTPLAEVISAADAAQAPEWFTTAPAKAIPLAIERAGIKISDVDLFEINEAFSVVALANLKELKISADNTNIYGGAVSLGHPLGCSGARIITTLVNALHNENKSIGVAGICNGGGGASAMVIKKV